MFGDHTMDIKPSSFLFSSNYYFESFGWSYLFLSKKIFEFDSIFFFVVVVGIYIKIPIYFLKG
jgi:hypothetical protein